MLGHECVRQKWSLIVREKLIQASDKGVSSFSVLPSARWLTPAVMGAMERCTNITARNLRLRSQLQNLVFMAMNVQRAEADAVIVRVATHVVWGN